METEAAKMIGAGLAAIGVLTYRWVFRPLRLASVSCSATT